MSFDHAVVWIDYAEACVSRFDRELARTETIKTYHPEPGAASARRSLRSPDTARHFDDIARLLGPARGILILGPGFERLELLVHLRRHYPETADRIVALETADSPREEEVLPPARRHFAMQ